MKTTNRKRIFILAGSHKQAESFATEKGLLPRQWIYLHSPEQLLGLRGEPYIKCGTWHLNKRLSDIALMLAATEMKEYVDISF